MKTLFPSMHMPALNPSPRSAERALETSGPSSPADSENRLENLYRESSEGSPTNPSIAGVEASHTRE